MAKSADKSRANEGEVLVAGGGLAGLTAALAAARSGFNVIICAPKTGEADGRTTALLADSVRYLAELGVWREAEAAAAPLRIMRIIDATNRLIRAPQVDFVSQEIGLEAFGYNIENTALAKAIFDELEKLGNAAILAQAVETVSLTPGSGVEVVLRGGRTLHCAALLAADGRNSTVRQSLDIDVRDWRYDQMAMVGNFRHTLPHHETSTEFHTETGPTTVVPLTENTSGLVCVENRAGAEALLAMDPKSRDLQLERRMHSILGKIEMITGPQLFPLSAMVAREFGRGPVVLIGEAAHVFPPIGAQGFNLGLRDIEAAVRLLNTHRSGGFAGLGEAYHRARSPDIHGRTASVDMLNRSLLSDFLPVQAARSFGLYALGAIPPLRRLMMREGVAPGSGLRLPGWLRSQERKAG